MKSKLSASTESWSFLPFARKALFFLNQKLFPSWAGSHFWRALLFQLEPRYSRDAPSAYQCKQGNLNPTVNQINLLFLLERTWLWTFRVSLPSSVFSLVFSLSTHSLVWHYFPESSSRPPTFVRLSFDFRSTFFRLVLTCSKRIFHSVLHPSIDHIRCGLQMAPSERTNVIKARLIRLDESISYQLYRCVPKSKQWHSILKG